MPVFGTFRRRRGGSLPCLQKGGPIPPSPKPPVFRRREPMGVPGQASPSIRAECKGHAQAAQSGRPGSLPGLRSRGRIRPRPPNLVLLAPRKDGAAAGGIPLPRRLLADTWRLKQIRCPSACNKAWRT
nr:MAG TPA: hypothetical protein [Caudoviricetes sp.]